MEVKVMKRKIALAQLDIQLGNPAERYRCLAGDVEYWLCLRSIIRLGR